MYYNIKMHYFNKKYILNLEIHIIIYNLECTIVCSKSIFNLKKYIKLYNHIYQYILNYILKYIF